MMTFFNGARYIFYPALDVSCLSDSYKNNFILHVETWNIIQKQHLGNKYITPKKYNVYIMV